MSNMSDKSDKSDKSDSSNMAKLSRSARFEASIQEIKTYARVALHFHPDRPDAGGQSVAESLLNTGRYRSQFETGISNGGLTAHPGGARQHWEEKLFGGAYENSNAEAEAKAHERPNTAPSTSCGMPTALHRVSAPVISCSDRRFRTGPRSPTWIRVKSPRSEEHSKPLTTSSLRC
jgi:hypothetical protein